MPARKKNEFKLEQVAVRLVKEKGLKSKEKIGSPMDAVRLVGDYIRDFDRESVVVINLNGDGSVANFSVVSIGSLNASLAHPREILKSSILSNAANIILVHNHPSGSLHPSITDTELTSRIIKVCDMVEIPILDHIIVGDDPNTFFSFKQKGLMICEHEKEEVDYAKIEFHSLGVAQDFQETKSQETGAAELEPVPRRRGR